jgi:hypothetical protein
MFTSPVWAQGEAETVSRILLGPEDAAGIFRLHLEIAEQ